MLDRVWLQYSNNVSKTKIEVYFLGLILQRLSVWLPTPRNKLRLDIAAFAARWRSMRKFCARFSRDAREI